MTHIERNMVVFFSSVCDFSKIAGGLLSERGCWTRWTFGLQQQGFSYVLPRASCTHNAVQQPHHFALPCFFSFQRLSHLFSLVGTSKPLAVYEKQHTEQCHFCTGE